MGKQFYLCLVYILLIQLTFQRQQFLGPNQSHRRKKTFVDPNPLDQNIITLGNENKQNNDHHQQEQVQVQQEDQQQQEEGQPMVELSSDSSQNFLQSQSPLDSESQDFNEQHYQKSDYYIWEEGVTNLAYDDFLTTKFVNNIEYLGTGYNIAYANPRSSEGIDPGYRLYNAFSYEYHSDKLKALSTDADYFVPKGVNLNTKTACQITFDSKSYSSVLTYKESLKAGVSIKGKYPSYAFQASADFKSTEQGMQSSSSTYIETSAKCAVHHLGISRFSPPRWSYNLKQALLQLADSSDEEDFYAFFEDFGTHVTLEVDLGALYGYKYEMNRQKTQQYTSQGIDVEASVKAYGTKGSASTSYSTQQKEAAENSMESWSMFTIGAPPDEDNNPMKWAAQSKDSPMPIKGSFILWADFLQQYYINKNQNGITVQQRNQLKNKFNTHYGNYCEKYLVPTGIVAQCEYQQASSNPIEDGTNVPGGIKNPAIDYTQIGGDSGYKWTEIDELGEGNLFVACDELGYAYVINSANKIKYKKPGQSQWRTLSGKTGTQIGAASGRIVLMNDDHEGYYKDVGINAAWVKLVGDYRGIDIDQNQKIVGIKEGGKGALLNGANDQNRDINGDLRLQWININGANVYAQRRSKSYDLLYRYDNSGVKNGGQKVQEDSKAISGCITTAGWGWKIDDNNQIWFLDVVQPDVIPKQIGGRFKQVYCQSTEDGPLIYALNRDGAVYFREAQ